MISCGRLVLVTAESRFCYIPIYVTHFENRQKKWSIEINLLYFMQQLKHRKKTTGVSVVMNKTQKCKVKI